MRIFLKEPEYLLGCFGFISGRSIRRSTIWAGVTLSALAVMLASVLVLIHRSTPKLLGETAFLVVCSWVVVFGLFRLFLSGVMWVFDQVADLFSHAIPGLTGPLHYLSLGSWYFFETSLTLGFIYFLGYALLLPFGIVQPL